MISTYIKLFILKLFVTALSPSIALSVVQNSLSGKLKGQRKSYICGKL